MTVLSMATAVALLAGVGVNDVPTGSAAVAGVGAGTATVIQVKHGYFRRDLGLDPAYSNYRQNNGNSSNANKNTRGYRLEGAPHNEPAGIQIYYDGGHHYIGHNGLRFRHNDPELLGK